MKFESYMMLTLYLAFFIYITSNFNTVRCASDPPAADGASDEGHSFMWYFTGKNPDGTYSFGWVQCLVLFIVLLVIVGIVFAILKMCKGKE